MDKSAQFNDIGKPTMDHKELDFGGDDLKGMLERQIALETADVEKYKHRIETIDDPEVVGVLRHILDEEKRHRKEFKERRQNICELTTDPPIGQLTTRFYILLFKGSMGLILISKIR
ncbi:MAG TPA: ferritin-like domain-containing protein [Methanocella sp.]|uniref:ferritin-like domain-containing protein n=1 Tax=Methanocella sp. TaxID=2052833 RepID=UPI002C376108|nr:ferritin-like domain-containing protein [Methanocella sp.]HTY92120.1 ferritin-like domain-containing protein [Methanocella sp.]